MFCSHNNFILNLNGIALSYFKYLHNSYLLRSCFCRYRNMKTDCMTILCHGYPVEVCEVLAGCGSGSAIWRVLCSDSPGGERDGLHSQDIVHSTGNRKDIVQDIDHKTGKRAKSIQDINHNTGGGVAIVPTCVKPQ